MMTMIFFKAKPAATAPVKPEQPTTVESSKRGEGAGSGKRKKSDADGALRGQRKTTDDDRLI
jgi:hypothetical protein